MTFKSIASQFSDKRCFSSFLCSDIVCYLDEAAGTVGALRQSESQAEHGEWCACPLGRVHLQRQITPGPGWESHRYRSRRGCLLCFLEECFASLIFISFVFLSVSFFLQTGNPWTTSRPWHSSILMCPLGQNLEGSKLVPNNTTPGNLNFKGKMK